MNFYEIIKRPLLTEKTSTENDRTNRYCFEVLLSANKYQIKEAAEKIFNVKILDVNTLVIPGRTKRSAKGTKKSSSWKKAYIQVQDGQKLELFKGI